MIQYINRSLVATTTVTVGASDTMTAFFLPCGHVRSEVCLPDRGHRTPALENKIDAWFFGAVAIVSLIGLCMALKNKKPQLALFIVSFPGFALQFMLVGTSIYSEIKKYSYASMIDYLIKPLLFTFIIDFIFLGLPLIPFLVMVGVITISVPPNQGLTRWTAVTATVLALTILSYAISAYINFAVALPY